MDLNKFNVYFIIMKSEAIRIHIHFFFHLFRANVQPDAV